MVNTTHLAPLSPSSLEHKVFFRTNRRYFVSETFSTRLDCGGPLGPGRTPRDPPQSSREKRRFLDKCYYSLGKNVNFPDFYSFLPIFRTFLGDFTPDGLDCRSLQTVWEWKNRVPLEEHYIFNVAIPPWDPPSRVVKVGEMKYMCFVSKNSRSFWSEFRDSLGESTLLRTKTRQKSGEHREVVVFT